MVENNLKFPTIAIAILRKQAGAELCQAQVKLDVIVDVVMEAWS